MGTGACLVHQCLVFPYECLGAGPARYLRLPTPLLYCSVSATLRAGVDGGAELAYGRTSGVTSLHRFVCDRWSKSGRVSARADRSQRDEFRPTLEVLGVSRWLRVSARC